MENFKRIRISFKSRRKCPPLVTRFSYGVVFSDAVKKVRNAGRQTRQDPFNRWINYQLRPCKIGSLISRLSFH